MDQTIRSQQEIFGDAMESVAHELDQNMFSLTFSTMLEELERAAIESRETGDRRDSVRFFSRHHLNMKGERYKEVLDWIKGSLAMSIDDIVCVLRALNSSRTNISDIRTDRRGNSSPAPIDQPTSGVIRRIIDHSIGSFNSIAGLIVEAGIKPEHAYDSDRMDIQGAVQRICDRFGIAINFTEVETQPLTRKDLAEIGFEKKTKRRI